MSRSRFVVALLAIAALPLSACAEVAAPTATVVTTAKVEKVEGTELSRLVLAPRAAKRIGIKTARVRGVAPSGDAIETRTVDYSALIYDLQGNTFVYTNPQPLAFVRSPIKVDRIDGDVVFVSDGPPVGTAVVIVGAAQLFGIEFGVGK